MSNAYDLSKIKIKRPAPVVVVRFISPYNIDNVKIKRV